VSGGATFPRLLCQLAAEHPSRHAMREKRYGIWQPITWAEHEQRVRRFAGGLDTLGFQRRETIAVLGDNRPEWLIAELAAQSLGGSSLGLYPDAIVEELAHVLTQGQVRFVVAADQEQVDKLVELKERGAIDTVSRVIYYDSRGLERYQQPYLIEFTDVERRGSEHPPGWWAEQVERGRPEDVAILCTTAGTTAEPKLAALTHANLLWLGSSLMSEDPIDRDDEILSFLPLAWIGEQVIAIACALQSAFTLSFPESAATVQSDLREIGPRVLLSPPRIWESMHGHVQVRAGDTGWLKRRALRWGLEVGKRAAAARLRGGTPGIGLRVTLPVANVVALRPVREQLGLTRLRRAYAAGAPLGPEVFEFFHAIGVNLKQIYGQTEICGIATMHRDSDIRLNTVGTALPGTDLRIARDGEILLRSPAMFGGYHRDERSTAGALRDGWLHTGDAGYLEADGQLVVIDRAKDVMQAPDGTRVSPSFVESKLKFSPDVTEAVAFGGESRPYVTAMMSIDAVSVGAWAQRRHLSFTTYGDLAQKPEVYELIARHVVRVNEELPEAARVKRFVLLHKQLDADDGELTRTRTLRRGAITERYAAIIAALYGDVSRVTIRTTATHRDGSDAKREITLAIRSIDGLAVAAEPAVKSRRQLAPSA
jgi:long-chain acyl-CoA synthetase